MNQQQYPYHVIPPTFPQKFPFHTNHYQEQTPYDYFQKPPIPQQFFNQQQSQGGFGGNPFIQQFQNNKGQMDFDKIFSTVGQLVNTVNQVQPIVKKVGYLIKGFK